MFLYGSHRKQRCPGVDLKRLLEGRQNKGVFYHNPHDKLGQYRSYWLGVLTCLALTQGVQ